MEPGCHASRFSFLGTHVSLSEAFVGAVDAALSHGRVNAGRAQPNLELPSLAFVLENPRARLIDMAARKVSIPFLMAEFLWQAASRSDVEMLQAYAAGIARFSADGRHFTGSAYGARLFGDRTPGQPSQWTSMLECLRDDPESRRALLTLTSPGENRLRTNRDVTCTIALHFLVRNGRLDMTVVMRSNDIMRGLQSDVFFFTMLQEIAAIELELELGSYTHVANVAQVFASDRAWAERCHHDVIRSEGVMPPMVRGSIWREIQALVALEAGLRAAADASADATVLPSFRGWPSVLQTFHQHRRAGVSTAGVDWVSAYQSALAVQSS